MPSFSLCFSNWVICPDCLREANEAFEQPNSANLVPDAKHGCWHCQDIQAPLFFPADGEGWGICQSCAESGARLVGQFVPNLDAPTGQLALVDSGEVLAEVRPIKRTSAMQKRTRTKSQDVPIPTTHTISRDMFDSRVLQIHAAIGDKQQLIGTVTRKARGFTATSKMIDATRPFATKEKAVAFLLQCVGKTKAPKPSNDSNYSLF